MNVRNDLTVAQDVIDQSHPTKRVVLYARAGAQKAEHRSQFTSCTGQIQRLEREAERRNWTVVAVVSDDGYSAGSLNRPGLTRLRAMAQNGELDVVLLTGSDRLTRDVGVFRLIRDEFKKCGVALEVIRHRQNTTSTAGQFMEAVLASAKSFKPEQIDKTDEQAGQGTLWPA